MSAVPSTAATSVSGGDSTSTTPGPTKKDFGGFGVTPTGTPAPEEKEKKGFAFGGTSSSSEEKKEGAAPVAFGAKKEEEKGETAAKGPVGVSAEPKGDAAIQNMKNKTMEEIIQKWTGELDRCSEQFKTQANNIRRWDSILVDNGDKVARLPSLYKANPGLDLQVVHRDVGSNPRPRPNRHRPNLHRRLPIRTVPLARSLRRRRPRSL